MHIGGIIQGRLLPPVDGHIQEFPKDNWREEFDRLDELGLTHIEWIITKKSFEEGVLDLDIREYADRISSICCDNLIHKDIRDNRFLAEQLRPICDFAVKNGIGVIGIPLLEDSEVYYHNKRVIIDALAPYGEVYPELEFHFEMEAPVDIATELVGACHNFFFTYDTGNITSCGYDHSDYLQAMLPKIKNVHLKDRTRDPIATVEPGAGDTDFELIFDVLKKNNYICSLTIQTARGEDGKELETIKRHKKFYEQFI
jgi:hexulose-6-phosphate isomerase